MKTTSIIPLVNWGMGAIIIGVFAVVCVVMVLIIYNMVNSDKKNSNETE
jgi:uncharacterized membrane protein